jgi:hypothetical protein
MRIAFHLAGGPRDGGDFAPLGFGYLAAYLREEGVDAKCSVEPDLEALLAVDPDVVAISCSSPNYGLALAAARLLRERCRAAIVAGGPHLTLLPASFQPVFDAGVVGECEETFAHLLAVFEHTGALDAADLANVPGLVYWADGAPALTAARPPIEPLDGIPAPDRAILPRARFQHIVTGRGGLPGSRAFAKWGGIRLFSADRTAAELLDLIREGYRRVHIFDDTFVDDPERLIRIADVLEEEEALGAAKLMCTAPVEALTDSLVEMLVRLGVDAVSVRLPHFEESAARAALARLDEYNVAGRILTAVGAPAETPAEMRRTFAFLAEQAVQGRLADARVGIAVPAPGDDTWDLAVERGLIGDLTAFDWSRLGAPWRGLLLNPHVAAHAGRLVDWSRYLAAIFAALRRPTVIVAPDEIDLDLEADPSAVRAVFLLADEPGVAEAIDSDEIDLARFGPAEMRRQLQDLVDRFGGAPLVMFAPDPRQATPAVTRACKLALTLRQAKFVRSRAGAFPLLTTCAEALRLDDAHFAALVRGDESAAPDDVVVAEPQELRRLPAADFDAPHAFAGDPIALFDELAASFAPPRER